MDSDGLLDYFKQIAVINLDRRPDRWRQFVDHLAEIDWPFRPPVRFSAVDGEVIPHPDWFQPGAGAWACQLSHMRVIEEALKNQTENVLILEDDVRFPADLRERAARFLGQVPSDWHQLYLGGQHVLTDTQPPMELNSEVLTPYAVGRTHAYALHQPYYATLYRALSGFPTQAKNPNAHLDYRMVDLHETGCYGIFAPHEWMAVQGDNLSDISCQQEGERGWHPTQIRGNSTPFVAVVGLHRSGSSCLAGVLRKLGVFMGRDLGGYEETGGYEARGLAKLCERAYPFPSTERRGARRQLVNALLIHIRYGQEAARRNGTIAGGKYPHLCAMGDELREVCGDKLKVIHIDRPLEDSIASLQDRSEKAQGRFRIRDDDAEDVQRWLWREKRSFLASVEHLTVKYHDLLSDPRRKVGRIVDFLGLKASEASVDQAVEHVRPSLRSH